MKFNKAKKNLLSEYDYSSVAGMKKSDKLMDASHPEQMRIRILKKMGADREAISRWRAVERKGISFEAFLIGLVDELTSQDEE